MIMERQKYKRPKCIFSKVYAFRDNSCLIFAFKLNFHIVLDTLIHREVVGRDEKTFFITWPIVFANIVCFVVFDLRTKCNVRDN